MRDLAVQTPRTGLAAPTRDFVDDLIARAQRYGDHLFVCFDDPRIPGTTNELEGFFGATKARIRRALAAKSTTNGVVGNLGAELLVASHHLHRPNALASVREPAATPAEFSTIRERLERAEAPAVRQRSLVRNFKQHVQRLRTAWAGAD